MRLVRAAWPWCMTKTAVIKKMTVQPLSVRTPTYIRDMYVRDRKMCACWSAAGSLGRGGIPLWVGFV